MKKAFSVLLILLLLCACKKQLDDKDYWSVRCSFIQNDEPVEWCWNGPLHEQESSVSLFDCLLGRVWFYQLTMPDPWGDPFFRSINDCFSCFSFGRCWSWIVFAPYILEDEKYYYDPAQEALYSDYPLDYPIYYSVPGPGYSGRMMVYSGWASFTTKVDDPEVRLRIYFEADCAEKADSPVFHVTNGVFDISNKVSIKGMDRLIQ